MIDGVKVTIQGKDYIVPPLNLKGIRKVQPLLPMLDRLSTLNGEAVDAVIEVIHTAMVRNYPDLTKDQVEDMIDLGNMPEVIEAIMNVSGLVPKTMPPSVQPGTVSP